MPRRKVKDDSVELTGLSGFQLITAEIGKHEHLTGFFVLPEAGLVLSPAEAVSMSPEEWVAYVRRHRLFDTDIQARTWGEDALYLCEVVVGWSRGPLGRLDVGEVRGLLVTDGRTGAIMPRTSPRLVALSCVGATLRGLLGKAKGRVNASTSWMGKKSTSRVFDGWRGKVDKSVLKPQGWCGLMGVQDPKFLEGWARALGQMNTFYDRQEYYARTSPVPPKWASGSSPVK